MITEQHNEQIKRLIGKIIVDQPTKGFLTLSQIYEYAEAIHPLKESHPAMLRVIEPRQMATDDYYENRLNIFINENKEIIAANWG
jgi:hypothetical protein